MCLVQIPGGVLQCVNPHTRFNLVPVSIEIPNSNGSSKLTLHIVYTSYHILASTKKTKKYSACGIVQLLLHLYALL